MDRENIDPTSRPPFHLIALVALLALSSLFLGTGILHTTFVSDDNGLILWGRQMVESDFWAPFFAGSMDPEKPGPTYYRPLALLSHGLDYAAYGWQPAGHHVTSLALHALCSLLVFLLVRIALPTHPPTFAIIATALFALHPIHEGAVWWIAGRMELVCTMFYLMSVLAFLTYVTGRQLRYLGAATALGAAAFASKEMAFSLPFVWLAIAFIWRNEGSLSTRVRTSFVIASPAIGLAAFFLVLRLFLFDSKATTFVMDVDTGHLFTTIRHTLRGMVLPYHVSFREWASTHTPWFVLGLISLLCMAALQVPRMFSRPVFLGVCWCALTMLPLVRTMSPWTLYLPSVGFCVALAWIVYPRRSVAGIAALAILVGVIVSYGIQLQARKASWQEADTVARSILIDFRQAQHETKNQQPVILALPGLIDDTAVFMHYFEDRVQVELDDPNLHPIILTHLILPPDVTTHGIEVHSSTDNEWELIPSSPRTRFAFPSVAAFNYRFDAVRPGQVIDTPWGEFELLSSNDPNTITRIRVRLDAALSHGPILVYRNGWLETLDAPSPPSQ